MFGLNFQINTQKAYAAKTPGERKARMQLLSPKNDEARKVVDKVDFVSKTMKELDGTGLDKDGAEGSVSVDGQAKQLGTIGRWLQAANQPLEAITTQAPKADQAPRVTGTRADNGDLSVNVEYSEGKSFLFSEKTDEDGSKVFQAGNQTVRMTNNGNLLME